MSTKATHEGEQTVSADDEQSASAPWENTSAEAEAASCGALPAVQTFNPSEEVRTLPHLPGCYRYFGADGTCLYVGEGLEKPCFLILSQNRTLPAHSADGEPHCAD